MSDNFANYPVSTSEVRANREEDCRLWSPRDALISILRDIDEGKVAPDALICIYRERGDDDARMAADGVDRSAHLRDAAIGDEQRVAQGHQFAAEFSALAGDPFAQTTALDGEFDQAPVHCCAPSPPRCAALSAASASRSAAVS